VVVKGLELRGVYVRSNECWGSPEAAIFTVLFGVIIGIQGDSVQMKVENYKA
jgi:hypothetical protein